jgi:hypothetical protein
LNAEPIKGDTRHTKEKKKKEKRKNIYQTYKATFDRMLHNMAWSLGYWKDDTDPELLIRLANQPELLNMVLTIGRVLTYDQVKDIIADPVEKTFLQQISAYQNTKDKRRQEWDLNMYGTASVNTINSIYGPLAYAVDLGYSTLDKFGITDLLTGNTADQSHSEDESKIKKTM